VSGGTYYTNMFHADLDILKHLQSNSASFLVYLVEQKTKQLGGGELVADAPILSCESSWAHVGDRNVFVRCKVKARPTVTAIFWILDGNGTTVTEGQVVNEHWTLVMVAIVTLIPLCSASILVG